MTSLQHSTSAGATASLSTPQQLLQLHTGNDFHNQHSLATPSQPNSHPLPFDMERFASLLMTGQEKIIQSAKEDKLLKESQRFACYLDSHATASDDGMTLAEYYGVASGGTKNIPRKDLLARITNFFASRPVKARQYKFILDLSDDDILSVVLFEFAQIYGPVNSSGLPLYKLWTKSKDSKFSVTEIIATIQLLTTFYKDLYGSHFAFMHSRFAVPLLETGYSYLPHTVHDIIARALSGLRILTPIPAGTIHSFLDSWILRWNTADRHSRFHLEALQMNQDLIMDKYSSLSSVSTLSNDSKKVDKTPNLKKRGRKDDTSDAVPVSKRIANPIDFSPLDGFCLSVFGTRPCRKIAAGKPCVSGANQVPLLHKVDFDKLPAEKQSHLRKSFAPIKAALEANRPQSKVF